MKSSSASLIAEMASVAISLCDTLLQKNDVNKEDALKRSFETRSKCIFELQKEFLPPFDREDMASIALGLHRLNERLCDVVCFSNSVYSSAEHFVALTYVSEVCRLIGRSDPKRIFKVEELLIPRPSYSYGDFNERYNPYKLVCEQRYSDLLKRCCDEAERLLDLLLRTVIKYS